MTSGDSKWTLYLTFVVVEAVQQQAARYMHVMVYGELVEAPQVEYAKRIAELLPDPPRIAASLAGGRSPQLRLMKFCQAVGKRGFARGAGALPEGSSDICIV